MECDCHKLPHWNWAGSEGKPIKVMVVSNAEKVELRLNGRSVGIMPIDKIEMATFEFDHGSYLVEARVIERPEGGESTGSISFAIDSPRG